MPQSVFALHGMCCLPAAWPRVLCMLPHGLPTCIACYICVCQLARHAIHSFMSGAACSPACSLCHFATHVCCSPACPVSCLSPNSMCFSPPCQQHYLCLYFHAWGAQLPAQGVICFPSVTVNLPASHSYCWSIATCATPLSAQGAICSTFRAAFLAALSCAACLSLHEGYVFP